MQNSCKTCGNMQKMRKNAKKCEIKPKVRYIAAIGKKCGMSAIEGKKCGTALLLKEKKK